MIGRSLLRLSARTRRVLIASASTATTSPSLPSSKLNLFGLPPQRLAAFFETLGQPRYRVHQLWRHLYGDLANPPATLETLTTLSKADRASLAEQFSVELGAIESVLTSTDGTRKFIVSIPANESKGGLGLFHKVECVFIPRDEDEDRDQEDSDNADGKEGDGKSKARLVRGTLCVSSQAGCSLACSFCHTGTQAFEGNLSAAAIVAQFLLVSRYLAQESQQKQKQTGTGTGTGTVMRISNIVFMGQGEPLLNWRSVQRALSILTDAKGINLPSQRITISTSGVAPLIPALADHRPTGHEPPVPVGIRLALSLHAPTEELRSRVMSVNRQWSLKQVMESCALFLTRKLTANEVLRKNKTSGGKSDDAKGLVASLATSALPLNELCRLHQRFGESHGSSKHRTRITFEYVCLKGVNDSLDHADELRSLLSGYLPLECCHVNLLPFHPWPGSPYEAPDPEQMLRFQRRLERGPPALASSCPAPNRGKRLQTHIRRSRGLDILGACGQLKSSTATKGLQRLQQTKKGEGEEKEGEGEVEEKVATGCAGDPASSAAVV